MAIYEPQEDSFLLKKHIKRYAKGSVLDMGTGSGILAEEASRYADTVIAIDCSEEAIAQCKKKFADTGIIFVKSDVFEVFSLGKMTRAFDLIVCNPPYLPNDRYPHPALDGGRKGYEWVERFLKEAKTYLTPKGKVLLLVSSLTSKPYVEKVMKQEGYFFNLIDKEKHAFETLYVYVIDQ